MTRRAKRRSLRRYAWLVAVVLLVCATLYPSDMDEYYSVSRHGHSNEFVVGIENYGRHINTVLPIATAVLLRDSSGLGQIAATTVLGVAATHIPKRLLDNVHVFGTRLGQRPNGGKHNMPSGHSALASAGAFLTTRRYSHWFGLVVWPVTLSTMYARYMLDAHTISATIAGAIMGILVAACCVSRLKRPQRLRPLPSTVWKRLRATYAA